MDTLHSFITKLAEQWPILMTILSIIGSIVVLGTTYILATKNKEDDAKLKKIEDHKLWGFLLRFLKRFSALERKKIEKKEEDGAPKADPK